MFLGCRQFGFEDQVEEFDGVLQGQEPSRRGNRVDAAEGKRLDRFIGARHHAVDHLRLIKALDLQIVLGVVSKEWPGLGAGGKWLQLLHFRHEVNLAATLWNVDPFLGGDDYFPARSE